MNRTTIRHLRGRARRPVAVLASSATALCAIGALVAAEDAAAAPSSEASAAANGGSSASGGASSRSGSGSSALKLKSEATAPRKAFFYGKRKATFHYSIAGQDARNLKIQAVRRKNWRVVRTWTRRGIEPGKVHAIRWAGTGKRGRPAPPGTYVFRVLTRHGAKAKRGRLSGGNRSFGLFPYKFPLRARHTYGDGYGAPRSGHVHQGQDILAKCGKRIVAARGGRIQYRGYQASGAGYYVVVDGKGTGHDYVYMHLRPHGLPKRGQIVRTGEPIGTVGETGDASGCHLHFEMWTKPGWYEGGRAMPSVTRHLSAWDRWS
ncbi:MAG: M23 family metallopeptidase [Solirubrobacterales bacterium]